MKKAFQLFLFSSTALALAANVQAEELMGVDIHGFISQSYITSSDYNYLTHNSEEGSFDYNEIGINFSKELTEKLRVGLQLYSRDIGDAGDNKVTIDWAYGDYRVKDWFGIRAGRIKLPLGLYNETRDIDMLRTNAIMPQSLYPDLLRDTTIAANGIGVYGNVPMSSVGSLEYQFIAGVIDIDPESGFSKYFNNEGGNRFSLRGSVDSNVAYAGSLKWNTPLDGLLFGVSALNASFENDVTLGPVFGPGAGRPGHTEISTDFITLSTEYTWKNLVVAAEYQQMKTENWLKGVARTETTSEGYYVSAAYRFSDLFSLGTHYSIYYPDEDDKNGHMQTFKADAWEKDLALTLKFDINEYCVFKIEGHRVDGTARVLDVDNPNKTEDEFFYGVAKVTFSF